MTRLTFRLDVLAAEAIDANDALFVEETGCTIRETRVLRLIDDYPGITFVEICRVTGMERSLTSLAHQAPAGSGAHSTGGCRQRRAALQPLDHTARQGTPHHRPCIVGQALDVLMCPLSKGLVSLKSMLDRLAMWVRSEDYKEALAEHRDGAGGTNPAKRAKSVDAAERAMQPRK